MIYDITVCDLSQKKFTGTLALQCEIEEHSDYYLIAINSHNFEEFFPNGKLNNLPLGKSMIAKADRKEYMFIPCHLENFSQAKKAAEEWALLFAYNTLHSKTLEVKDFPENCTPLTEAATKLKQDYPSLEVSIVY